MPQEIRTVAVVGGGVIGISWTLLFLSRGLKVILSDPAEGALEAFMRHTQDSWPLYEGTRNQLLERFEFVDDVTPRLAEADFVQENGPERLELKQQILETLDQHTRPGVVIASSSSGFLPSTIIELCQKEPSRILVGHPFNPPHLIPLVEVVPHPGTDQSSISTAMDFYKSLGKRPILLRQEVPGFVANRLQAAINNEAYSLISRGIVSASDLDAAVSSGPGLRWALTGPIAINALGGGSGADGFGQRLERLGPSIRSWEEDILRHRFDWSEKSVSKLKDEASKSLGGIDWAKVVEERELVLSHLLVTKSKTSTLI
ncbi:hypothetical protein GGI35DRAFT_468923 [Trichoderma velutinum]